MWMMALIRCQRPDSSSLFPSVQCDSQQRSKVLPSQKSSLSNARAFMRHVERVPRDIFGQPDRIETTDERADFVDFAAIAFQEDTFAFTFLHRNLVGPIVIQRTGELLPLQARVLTDLCDLRGKHNYPSLPAIDITTTSGTTDALPTDLPRKNEVRNWLGNELRYPPLRLFYPLRQIFAAGSTRLTSYFFKGLTEVRTRATQMSICLCRVKAIFCFEEKDRFFPS